ncbi:MAG: nicotinate (nicotinamide) nucleotide adenylyltransferase [Fusobacteriaceae bacterium]
MKIAVFGGSFNPIHLGHVKMVEYLCENFDFDKIIVIPAGIPAHKNGYSVSGIDRYNMCKLAFTSFSKVEVSSIEIETTGVCYTVDTLMSLKSRYRDADFYEVIGEDSANYFDTWKDFEKILRESRVIVFRRESEEEYRLPNRKNSFLYLETPYFQYSSTEIRYYLEKKSLEDNLKKLKEMLPQKTLDYIFEKNLYGNIEGEKNEI